MASWATASIYNNARAGTDCGQQRHGDCRRVYCSLFLKSDGSLWAMGGDYYGQLGDGRFITNAPYGTNQPEQIMSSNVMAIAAGSNHSLFLKNDGSLWAMGANYSGQLGDGTFNTTNRPEQIAGQQRHGNCRRRQFQPIS